MSISQDILEKYNLVLIDDERFIVRLMYATPENMASTAVYQEFGISEKEAYVHKELYDALLKLIPILEEKKLKLKIFDAFRPPLAHERLRDIVPIQNFFASKPERSNHCRGTAVDVCLCNENGTELEYPTAVDGYTAEFAAEVKNGNPQNFITHLEKARHDYYDNCNSIASANRDYLKKIMSEAGFEAIPHEWWHYNLRTILPYPMIDYQVHSHTPIVAP